MVVNYVNFIFMSVILITGGTGMVGKALTKVLLSLGHEVIVLTRDPAKNRVTPPGLSYAGWDIQKDYLDTTALAKADHIIHLAGAGVAERRWTPKRKKEIRDSRVLSSRLLVRNLSAVTHQVRSVVSSSAIGWYGPDPKNSHPAGFTEEAPPSSDFLGITCREWEQGIEDGMPAGIRIVKLRTGIVLAREGGAFREFLRSVRFRIAAIPGKGSQVISWIHLEDLVRIYIAAIENDKMKGVYNAVAPSPVTTRELVTRMAGNRGKRHLRIRVPALLLRIVLGEMSIEVLKSATVSCAKLVQTGFQFRYPDIRSALTELLR